MSINPDRPTLPERYAGAIDSSHLEVLPTRCSVDYLVAAGWVQETLGTALFRLRTEFDAVRGDHRLASVVSSEAAHEVRTMTAHAARIRRLAGQEDADSARRYRMDGDADVSEARAQARAREAERAALTARALMMTHLKTLGAARNAVHNFAQAKALRDGFKPGGKPDPKYRDQEQRRRAAVQRIAARALEVWIDPTCPHCNGRRFSGGGISPIVWCVPCGATGDRSQGPQAFRLAPDPEGHTFGRALLAAMDAKADYAARQMSGFMGKRQNPLHPHSTQELQAQLKDLRSAVAQED